MYRHQRDTIDSLTEEVRATNLPPLARLLVVFGYPRSDIGKGTLVSHLLPLLKDPNVVKFDGFLNTNADGRFMERDDFGLYMAQYPKLKMTKQNHLLGGHLLYDFIAKYGETDERLTLIPHLERYFRLELQQRWKALGEPRTLVVEMGGTPDDAETSYALAGIRELKVQLGDQCQIMLITELGHNSLYAKSKVAQRGVSELVARGLIPDIIVAREPHFDRQVSVSERLDFEIQLQERIVERTGINLNKIISMPYFSNLPSKQYKDFLEKNVLPLVQEPEKYPKVLLGTTDQPEIDEWKGLLGDVFELTTPQELKLDIEIGSDNSSIQRTSHARARSYSRMSSLPTITAEAALYINALGGRPGAGVRTWGGQLSQPMSNEEIFNYMRAAVAPLDDTSAYIEGSITVVLPNGDEHHLRTRDYGVIDKDKLAKDFEAGQYPIGQVFRHDSCGATWVDMTAAQRRQVRQEKLDRVLGVLSESVQSLKKK